MFCTTCGSLLHPKKTAYGKWMSCPEGHAQPELVTKTDTITSLNKTSSIIGISDGVNPLAVHDHECKKCGHDKCELIEVAPFYSDEDQFIRMKCGKCGFAEKLEGRTG